MIEDIPEAIKHVDFGSNSSDIALHNLTNISEVTIATKRHSPLVTVVTKNFGMQSLIMLAFLFCLLKLTVPTSDS